MSSVLVNIDPAFRMKIYALLTNCKARDVTMNPVSGLRLPQTQARLWRQSRSSAEVQTGIQFLNNNGAPFLASVLDHVGPIAYGPEVTRVLPGNSWHQWGLAVDCAWMVDEEYEDSDSKQINGINGYQVYAEEASKLGVTAGFFWPTFKDSMHVQDRPDDNPISSGLSWAQVDERMAASFGSLSDAVVAQLDAPSTVILPDTKLA